MPGILEAHLFEDFIDGDVDSRQLLVVEVLRRAQIPGITGELLDKLEFIFSPGDFVTIMAFETNLLPPGVREAGCRVFMRENKPFWKIW